MSAVRRGQISGPCVGLSAASGGAGLGGFRRNASYLVGAFLHFSTAHRLHLFVSSSVEIGSFSSVAFDSATVPDTSQIFLGV